jgi:hypothetical protein
MGWTKRVARMVGATNAFGLLIGKLYGKRELGRSRCRWEDIKMSFYLYGYEPDLSGSGHRRLAGLIVRTR